MPFGLTVTSVVHCSGDGIGAGECIDIGQCESGAVAAVGINKINRLGTQGKEEVEDNAAIVVEGGLIVGNIIEVSGACRVAIVLENQNVAGAHQQVVVVLLDRGGSIRVEHGHAKMSIGTILRRTQVEDVAKFAEPGRVKRWIDDLTVSERSDQIVLGFEVVSYDRPGHSLTDEKRLTVEKNKCPQQSEWASDGVESLAGSPQSRQKSRSKLARSISQTAR